MDTQTKQDARQALVNELAELGMFDPIMLEQVEEGRLAIGEDSGALREAVYRQWELETAAADEPDRISKMQTVLLGLLSRFDLYGLELLVEDARAVGVQLTYTWLLESAFQYATKIGDAYQTACSIGKSSWKGTYLVLKSQGWKP